MLVLSSPSGAGKTTIARELLERETNLKMSISHTTRPIRAGEIDGQDYYFVDTSEFFEMIQTDSFLEYAKVFGNYYGTSKAPVEEALSSNTDVLFDIDWQGAQQLERQKDSRKDLVSIFILPPNASELETRLRNRAQDSTEEVGRRMREAGDEMSHYNEYDYIVVNREIDESVNLVQAILKAERLRTDRQSGLNNFVKLLQG